MPGILMWHPEEADEIHAKIDAWAEKVIATMPGVVDQMCEMEQQYPTRLRGLTRRMVEKWYREGKDRRPPHCTPGNREPGMTFAVDALLRHLRKLPPKKASATRNCGVAPAPAPAPKANSVISDERYGLSVDAVLEGDHEMAKKLTCAFHAAHMNPNEKTANACAHEVDVAGDAIVRATSDNEGVSYESELLGGALKRVNLMIMVWLAELTHCNLVVHAKDEKAAEQYMVQRKAKAIDRFINKSAAALAANAFLPVCTEAKEREEAAARAAEQARFVSLYIDRRSATIARSACDRVLAVARARDEALAAEAARVRRLNVEAGELALRRAEDAARRRRAHAKEEKAAEQAAKLEKKKERARLDAEQKAAAEAAAEAARERKKAAFQREKARRKQEHEAAQREAEAAAAREKERRAAERKAAAAAAAAARRQAEAEAREREAQELRRRQEEEEAQKAYFEKRYSHELPQWRKKRDRARSKESPDYDMWRNAVLEGERGNWQDAASFAQAAGAMYNEWEKKCKREAEEAAREADEAAQAILAVQKAEEEEAAREARLQAVWEAGRRAEEEHKAEEAKRKAEFEAEAKRKLAAKQSIESERNRLKKEASVAAARVLCKSQAERVHEAQRKVDALHARFKAAEGAYLHHRTRLQHAWLVLQQAQAASAPQYVVASLAEKHRRILMEDTRLSDARRESQRQYDYERHLLNQEQNRYHLHGESVANAVRQEYVDAANQKSKVIATTKPTPLSSPPPPSPSSKAEGKKPATPPLPSPSPSPSPAASKPPADECGVCFTEFGDKCRKHALAPCGHQLCGKCAQEVQECPFCKQSISMRLQLF